MLENLDFNLLQALDVLLAEKSVTGAAQRLGLSASAMSRTLLRLRAVTGDPLLVRAGRGLVPTPRAAEIRDHVHALTHDIRTVLSPQNHQLDLASLDRTFVICANEGFVDLFATRFIAAIINQAPHARLRFAPKPDKTPERLRTGLVDIDIGVLGVSAPEIRTQLLFRDDFVGVVRSGHPLLSGPIDAQAYAESKHVVASRKGEFHGPVDDALEQLGLRRSVVAVVPGFRDALRVAQQSDLVALVPRLSLGSGTTTAERLTETLVSFELPVRTPAISISAMWHLRMQADPAHQWLRHIILKIC